MQELDDIALLRSFVDYNSEQAFATLVARHVDKVYSVARRHTNNPHHAEEITQAVFVILARKAASLRQNTILSSWLYQTARFAAITHLRSESRRVRREHEATMQSLPNDSDDAWTELAPLLDDAMARLDAKDRAAIVLRFFDGKPMKEIGDALAMSEDAAKKRVSRAVEKLRLFFMHRGVVVPAGVLMTAISANAIQAAPAALAGTATSVAIANGTAVSGSTLALVKGATKLMAWMKAKTAVIVAASVVLTAGTTTVIVKELVNAGVVQFDGRPVTVLAEFDWQELARQGRLAGGQVMKMSGETVLKVENATNQSLALQLLKIEKPPVTAMNYAVIGEIKYDRVGVGQLNMWSFFPPVQAGSQQPQYYSFTGDDGPGPAAKLLGRSDWRPFILPLDRTGKTYPESFFPPMDTNVTARPPMRLEVGLFLPTRGLVYVREVKLVEWKPEDKTTVASTSASR